ncbi:hypothetical protein G6O69_04280 [Pseudenhygromyxa sp. WMMC2535]|uniref:CIS tube protein n=1 Tax=Pseudenhygromyxa sp. WMMC2535 TaxID=2712867 RepID=UPI0015545395|nr:hypothetical protein [Pseudenhygromyxa sp. WMMC2535]NVB37035.1 hypothetical protein [Pseudenhygromyxa sp. WMMC2535]
MTSDDTRYLRGAFIAYDPGGYPDDDDKKRTIPFRFNPEGLSRSMEIEQAQGGQGTQGASSGGSSSQSEQSADAASGALKQSFDLLIRLDFADRHQASGELDDELGLLPEISALEDLLYPAEDEADEAADDQEPVEQRAPRPTVLFVWGRKRVFPVRVTSMTVNETMHDSQLVPVRAEIEISLEVVSESEARDNRAVQDALAFQARNRRRWARMFLDRTAQQNTNILPL